MTNVLQHGTQIEEKGLLGIEPFTTVPLLYEFYEALSSRWTSGMGCKLK